MIPLTERDAALDTLEGVVNSYVRKRGATIAGVIGQVARARQGGAPEDLVRARIRKGITDPPNADYDRVCELTRVFLTNATLEPKSRRIGRP